ncbi:MAG: hypothetical protein FD176_1981 [Rhodospirillaceae bacterium]|nr:MAG: hypothetical protein FD176_1981 [Rhodospirillaceae bacterium]TNC93871.1 MAG: hypothetical protein FD119_3676 [Stygiobacter sp.]
MQFTLMLIHELVKLVGLLLIGQLLVYVLSFGRHESNAVYRALRFLTSPVVGVVRRITPAKVADRHVPLVSFLLLFWVWAALIFIRLDLGQGAA